LLAKVCHCPKELLWRKRCINRFNVTYFCVINQFQELLEATCTRKYEKYCSWYSLK
jgi:hypothetical protein